MLIPTGPVTVGLETVLLPSRLQYDRANPTVLQVKVPRCRYGRVWCDILVWREAGPCVKPLGFPVQGGVTATLNMGQDDIPTLVQLVVTDLDLWVGALDRLSQSEALHALTHPARAVREAALLALRR